MEMKKHSVKGLRGLLVAVLFLLSMVTMLARPATTYAANQIGTVTISVEKFTIGQGYIIEPRRVAYYEGDTWADVLKRIPELQGKLNYENTNMGFYLAGINGVDSGQTVISDYILGLKGIDPEVTKNMKSETEPNLEEFSYGQNSGWVFYVNGKFPSVGMEFYPVNDEDICRIQYTITTGDTNRDTNMDKLSLTWLVAKANDVPEASRTPEFSVALENAVNILSDYDTTSSKIWTVYASLEKVLPVLPESISLDIGELKMEIDTPPYALSASITPEDADQAILWASSDPMVATVDNGIVTPVSAGDAIITAKTTNGLTAECKVSVAPRPMTSIQCDPQSLMLEKGASGQINIQYQPEVTTDEKSVDFSSDNPSVAAVDQDGLVTAVDKGTAVITATTPGGLQSTCTVKVANSAELAEAVSEHIRDLPPVENLVLSDKNMVLSVQSEYENLPDSAKVLVDSELVAKLEACVHQIGILQADQNAADEVIQLIDQLPQPEAIQMENAESVEQAGIGYRQILTPTQQKLVPAESVEKLIACENRIEAIIEADKKAAMQVEGLIADLPDYDALTLLDNPEVVSTRMAYDALNDYQREYVNNLRFLENAEKKMRFLVTEGVKGLDIEQPVDVNSDEVTRFIEAISAYDAMTETQQAAFTKDTLQQMEAGKQAVQKEANTDNGVTVAADWFIETSAPEASDNQYQVLENRIRTLYSSSAASLKKLYDITLTNLKTGENSDTLDAPVTVTIPAPADYQSYKNPVVVHQTNSGIGSASVETPEFTYNADDKTLTFQLKTFGPVGIADIPISLTGIKLAESSALVDKNGTHQLTVSFLPENTTDDRTLEWKSLNASIATVDDNGLVRGVQEGTTSIIATSKINPGLIAKCDITVMSSANALNPSKETVLEETKNYILSVDTNPDLSSQWNVIGLARSGLDVPQSYYDTFYNNAAGELAYQNGKLTNSKYSEYSKLILSMTAIGKDAQNIDGYNLFEYLADFKNVKKQGTNGPMWALIALNCNPNYAIPTVAGVSDQTTEEKLISYLLDREISGGGWAMSGDEPDSDMTGMGIQALAPYYGKDSRVTASIDRALTVLSQLQRAETGGYGTVGATETSESTAQVVTGLSALGIDCAKDPRFVKTGHWPMEALFDHYVAGGGFMHILPGNGDNGGAQAGVVDGMATEQGMYTTVAYQRLTEGKTSLYDMSDLNKLEAGGHGTGRSVGYGGVADLQGGNGSGSGSQGSKTSTVKKANAAAADDEFKPWDFTGAMLPYSKSVSKTPSGNEQLKKASIILGGTAAAMALLYVGGCALWPKLGKKP
ncbi:Ig-like domain-containing protein [Eubacterium sp.]|uniref:Ig-like domain-containing protein n=1 Tax=Eubacterium sp. TaxID=142586 RepID=UPI0026E0946E|nr:Ig-like domain-containing protein [Eubacterium sp.]MDO5433606.1 Ig-like domain-containing protein [Eubacterium sp.]